MPELVLNPQQEQPLTPDDVSDRLVDRRGDLVTIFPNTSEPVTGTLTDARVDAHGNERGGAMLVLTLDLACGNAHYGPRLERFSLTGDEWCHPLAPLWVRGADGSDSVLLATRG